MNEVHEELEREQKYFVLNKSKRTMLVRTIGMGSITDSDSFLVEDLMGPEIEAHSLTEDEIKGYDEKYWPFAVPVMRGVYYVIEDDLGYTLEDLPLNDESREFSPTFNNDLESALKMVNRKDAENVRNISGGTIIEMRD